MDLDLDLKTACHMDGSMSRHFLMLDNMSLDGLRDYDKGSMDDGHLGG
jgi:hypothetical protein